LEDRARPRSRADQSPPDADGRLLEQIRAGDVEAAHRFVREHYPAIYRYLLHLTRQPDVAEDLTQETFLQGWRRLETFQERGSLRSWLYRIAHREFLHLLQRRQAEPGLHTIAELAAPEANARLARVELRDVIDRLPLEQREVVLLYYLEGYTSTEIARIVEVPVGTVYSRLARAREHLRQELGEDDLTYLNDPLGPMRQWQWLSLDQMYALEVRLSLGGDAKEDPMERREFLRQAAVGAAGLALSETGKEVVDGRLTQKVTLAFKATALSDLCDHMRTKTGVHLTAGPSVADEKVTLFCKGMPLREVMRQLSRPFGYAWTRGKREGGEYRYELVQDLRSQLLEEELRNRDRNEALLALEREIDRYRPYLGLSPNEALARALRAPEAEKPLLEKYADVGWAPIQIYFRLSPQELAMLRAGQELIFSEAPGAGERQLPADLKRGVLECNRHYRLIRHADRLEFAKDANDPRAVPLADVPEVKAQLAIMIPESEPGQFQLTGHAGAFYHQSPEPRHRWSIMEGRPPYAVGRGPSFSQAATERRSAPEPRDPALKTPVTLRPQPSGFASHPSPLPPPRNGEGESRNAEPKVTTADVLEALHRATGLPIVADFYTRLYDPKHVSAQNQPLHALLDRLGETMRLRWRLEEETTASGAGKRWLQIRSATYYHDRLKEVPNRLLTRWAEVRRRHGMLPLDNLVEIARLSDAQLDGEEMRQGAIEWWGIPEWRLLRSRDFHPHVRFLGEFTSEQRQMMMRVGGLPFDKMSLAQQQAFLAHAVKGEPLRSFDELAGATLRVDYTQPGAFQWQKPGGFTPNRWVVRLEPGPTGRRLLIPPIRERTPEEALAAARRAFPPITPTLLAAFHQSDPRLDADQILPQPGQIFPTELDLVVVYIPGTATPRGFRWFRRGQGPLIGDHAG
jgi:RNA polymerase sigma-70 factor (ECF subfamily)